MNKLELSKLIQSEQDCEEYLRKVGILKTFKECPKCNSSMIGKIRRNKYLFEMIAVTSKRIRRI